MFSANINTQASLFEENPFKRIVIAQAYHSPLQRGGVSSPKGCAGEGLFI